MLSPFVPLWLLAFGPFIPVCLAIVLVAIVLLAGRLIAKGRFWAPIGLLLGAYVATVVFIFVAGEVAR